jgi:hypothetical protein
MSDDFGTINLRRGERARELEVLRQHYRQHREALARMIADAPTELLATEYQRLIAEIDRSLGKLSELDASLVDRTALEGTAPPPPPSRLKTEPGMRPLVTAASLDDGEPSMRDDLPPGEEEPRSRVPLILAAAVIALALIGWLIWHASSDRRAAAPVIAESGTSAPVSTAPDTAVEEPPTPAPAASILAVTPPSHDYGTIRKGTRATRQFEVANRGNEPVSITVARSACRCLYYEYAPLVPPKAKETITVTVDGAKAKAGDLHETLKITLRKDPTVETSVEVRAKIQ